ncbi:2-dehydropantoate 2-reductase [Geobacter sp. AOG2]|uniref:2-dehydropantoate 2-reductase n=1 Tax=Geobacter sp. AOG2 TaxID=1566347 RepID=UPI001CC432F4|nr:2-dehydropantoate 2-reductase [Geobacter sp. AOG2]GFE61823.1 2-dehydropantoate 2-reductase [Geobacter sp. AOG2]
MKICIYGVGAVGGFIGAQLAHAGCDINAVAQGATLRALQRHGLRLQTGDQEIAEKVNATDNPATLGVQDLVIIAVKATALVDIARKISPLIGPDTLVMIAMNGVPWWFFDGFGGDYSGMRLESVDPVGEIAAAIPARNVIGCVVHGSFCLNEPGYVRHVFGNRLIIGEPDGTLSERVAGLQSLLSQAAMDIEVSRNIQADIWFKLWGNMTMNPISAITGATCDKILDDPLVKRFCLDAMAEAARIGNRIGCPITQSGEERMALTRKLGAFKTSMLQDVEAGRAVELDALVGAVQEIGRKVGEATPNIDALLGMARLHAQVRGLYPEAG